MVRFFLAAATAAMLAGCGANNFVAERQAIAQTEFTLAQVLLDRVDMPFFGENPGAQMRLALDVKNPNPITARLDRMDYQVFMEGQHVGDGALAQEFAVEAGQTGRLELPVFVPYRSFPDATRVFQARKAHLTLKGVSHVATILGAIDFPVEVSREVTF